MRATIRRPYQEIDPRYAMPYRVIDQERNQLPRYIPHEQEPVETDGPVRIIMRAGKRVNEVRR